MTASPIQRLQGLKTLVSTFLKHVFQAVYLLCVTEVNCVISSSKNLRISSVATLSLC